jgi:Cd2+/Zn2+-exporting ATPase
MTDDSDAGDGGDGNSRQAVTVRLAVPEMDCPTCVGKVDASLGRVDGVTDATLQPTTGTAAVT